MWGISCGCAILLAITQLYALMIGSWYWELFEIIAPLPWGRVLMLNSLVGTLFSGSWILYREGTTITTWFWLGGLIFFQQLTLSLYLMKTIFQSKGDWQRFWLGS